MKKLLNQLALIFLLCAIASACTSERVKNPVEKYVESLVKQYPNYETNEIARAAVKDSVMQHMKAAVGKPSTDIQDVEFKFKRLVEDGDKKAALFEANVNTFNDVEGKESMMSSILIHALCVVDDETAAKLDGDKVYSISGTLDDWGENDLYMGISTTQTIDFGVLLFNHATIEPIKAK